MQMIVQEFMVSDLTSLYIILYILISPTCVCTVQSSTLMFHNRSKSDEGKYTCRSVNNHSIKDEMLIQVDGMYVCSGLMHELIETW